MTKLDLDSIWEIDKKLHIQFCAQPIILYCLPAEISANREEWPLPLLRIVKLRGSKLSSALTMEAADCAWPIVSPNIRIQLSV
jgi:hypothetical protein